MTAGLAITGSQRAVGVAAWRDGRDVIAVNHLDPARDRDWLWPSIDEACRRAGVVASELSWIAVDIGPGGFSGLRTTIAAAQSIAMVHGLPCIAVPSALVAACSVWPDVAACAHASATCAHASGGGSGASLAGMSVSAHAVLVVKGATAWIATLERDEDGWRQCAASVIEWGRWAPRAGSLVLGDAHCPAALRESCEAHGATMVEPTWTGTGVMNAARRLWQDGQFVRPCALSPEYAREPEAVTLWRQRHGG